MTTDTPAHILIVDDTPTNIEILLGMLEDNYQVSFATSGHRALELLATQTPPDLILLDVMMPEMDGYEVCAALKANPATRDIPVIFVTAKTDADSESRALTAGAVDFIHKPVTRRVVSARIALHLELACHRHHLESLVHERTRELAAARDEAESATRAKSAFLANLGHELRTPLNHIIGQTYLLRGDIPDPDLRDRLGLIDRASRHLLQIINDLLDLSRIEADRLTLAVDDFDLGALCEAITQGARDLAAAKGLELITELDPALPGWLRGDRGRLQQLLTNLLDNAIKFSERGRIALRLSRLDVHDGAVTMRCEVEDQGIGIAPELITSLFQPFKQGDEATNRKYAGTGLGLALCKRLVSLMAGEIGVESLPGQGSTFWLSVRLPIAAPPEVAETAAPAASETIDREQIRAAATRLSVLLTEGDMEAQSLFADTPGLFEPLLQGRSEAFRDALAAYDFDRAAQLLQEGLAMFWLDPGVA